MMHSHGRLTLLPCGTGMLLVTLTRQKSKSTGRCGKKTRELALLVNEL